MDAMDISSIYHGIIEDTKRGLFEITNMVLEHKRTLGINWKFKEEASSGWTKLILELFISQPNVISVDED